MDKLGLSLRLKMSLDALMNFEIQHLSIRTGTDLVLCNVSLSDEKGDYTCCVRVMTGIAEDRVHHFDMSSSGCAKSMILISSLIARHTQSESMLTKLTSKWSPVLKNRYFKDFKLFEDSHSVECELTS